MIRGRKAELKAEVSAQVRPLRIVRLDVDVKDDELRRYVAVELIPGVALLGNRHIVRPGVAVVHC